MIIDQEKVHKLFSERQEMKAKAIQEEAEKEVKNLEGYMKGMLCKGLSPTIYIEPNIELNGYKISIRYYQDQRELRHVTSQITLKTKLPNFIKEYIQGLLLDYPEYFG